MLRGLTRDAVAELLEVHVKTVANYQRFGVPEAMEDRVRRLLFTERPLASVSNETLLTEVLFRFGRLIALEATAPPGQAQLQHLADASGWVDIPAPVDAEAEPYEPTQLRREG